MQKVNKSETEIRVDGDRDTARKMWTTSVNIGGNFQLKTF